MYNTIDEYKKYKIYESMIFGNIDYRKLSELCNVHDVLFLKKTIIHMLINHYLSNNELDNIYSILEYFINNNMDNSIVNSILKQLNKDFSNNLYFYIKEMFIRTKKFKYLNKLSNNEINSIKNEVEYYLSIDLMILDNLTKSDAIQFNTNKEALIYSMRTFLHEYPDMFTDKNIYVKFKDLISIYDDNVTLKLKEKVDKKVKKINKRRLI